LYKSSHDKVISTIYSRNLFSLITFTPSLGATTAVTIRLVNLWSPHPNLNFPNNGFGYLLPQTVPLDQNPHAALGVIFDSDLKPPGSTPDTPSYGDTVPGTKITVMLGGHHWSDLPRAYLPDPYTSDSAAIAAAKETVAIQLGIPPEAWTVASTKLCKDCIPQQLVGHTKRMKKANRELLAAFDGKLAVCGGSYTAPGVPGSLRAARDVAAQVAGRMTDRNGKEMPDSVGATGLARFEGDPMRFWGMERTDWMEGFRKEKKEEEEEW
jgi:oxygen-dependent protoporphyrinogen oxidase